MQMFGRGFCVPFKLRKPLRRIHEWLVFVIHVGDEVVPDVVDGFHVIATLLHEGVAVVPTEAHQTNTALDAQARSFRSEEHTSELQSHSFIPYAVFCLKKK